MNEKKPFKGERGNVRYLWVLVGAYLLYLAYQQLQLFLRGEVTKTVDILVCGVSGVVFAAVGAWVIYREWRAWQYAQAHKDDPETWEAEPQQESVPETDENQTSDNVSAPELPDPDEAEAADSVEPDAEAEERGRGEES